MAGRVSKQKVSQVKCKRCGKCCWYLDNNTIWKPCRFLVTDSKGFTACSRYHKRLGTYVGNFQKCGLRSDYRYDIPGCPYNTGKPVHPLFK